MTSLKTDLARAHAGQSYHSYRCTGATCDFTIAWVLDGIDILGHCSTPGCRGRLLPSYAVSAKTVVAALLDGMEQWNRPANSPFDPPIWGHSSESAALGTGPKGMTPASPESVSDSILRPRELA